MIQHNETTKCETNMSGGSKFTIQANAKMFRILSSGLYSNKERAIIREVSCNAYDANVDAGNGNIPIEVHLPNILEPYFSIKDSGPGLSPEQMKNIYTQYGNSTKTDRNDQIGALGLGSKSPFSYLDSFSVISTTNGEKNTYSCYIDANGEPQLQPFGTERTDEVNGVEVTFPVKQEDFEKFKKEAEIVYRPFEVKPKVLGRSDYEVKSFKVLLSSDDSELAEWQLVQDDSRKHYNRDTIRVAVQGNIEYPISIHQIENLLSPKAKNLVRENYRLRFDIGELDIAASREELGYDKITINNIVKKFEKMASEIEKAQQTKIDTFSTKYEAMSYISTINYRTNIYQNAKFEYCGEPISTSVRIPLDFSVTKYHKNNRGTISRTNLAKDAWEDTYYFRIHKEDQEVEWILNDDNKKTKSVTKAKSKVNNGNIVYLVQDKKFFDLIGNPEYLNASEIDLPENKSKKNSSGRGRFFKNWTFTKHKGLQWNTSFQNAEYVGLDVEKDFYYVELQGSKPTNFFMLHNYFYVAKELGLIDTNTPIYGVTSTHSKTKKFQKYPGIEFTEFIKNKIKNSKKFKEKVLKISEQNIINNYNNLPSVFKDLMNNKSFMDSLSDDNLFVQVKNDFDKIIGVDDFLMKNIVFLANNLNIEVPKETYTKHNKLINTYPLLINLYSYFENNQIIDYVKGIDLLAKSRQDIANEVSNKKGESINV